MVYGAKSFTGTTTSDIMLTVIFPGFKWSYNRSNQFNNTNMCIDKLNSTESFLWFLGTKILPELDLNLRMLY